jgi:hypothetical protein
MDTKPRQTMFEIIKHRASSAITRVRAILSTTFAENLVVGLVVILIARYVFGIG